jgi:N-acetylneuraminic acid mutarotase
MIVISGARAASYEPATNSWKRIAQPPAARGNGTAVWDGREMLVFGGTRNGFAYSPQSDSWRALPLVPGGRVGDVAVWTGKLLLLWGGNRGGAAYDPSSNRWSGFSSGPLPVRLEPSAVWTGRSLIVWGGLRTKTWGHYDSSGAVFTPAG